MGSQLVDLATALQSKLDGMQADLDTKTQLCQTLQSNNEKLLETIALLKSDIRAHGLNVSDGDDVEPMSIAALRSAVVAISGNDWSRENWLERSGWRRTADGGWREAPLSGTIPFATACDIEIHKQLGPFAWLLKNPSEASAPGDGR